MSDLHISEVSLGCMSLGNDPIVNANIIDAALDAGMNFFDTADLYDNGNNEINLAKALGSNRQRALIATKVGNQWISESNWLWAPNKNYILNAVEKSLQRLCTDCIDLYQLHGGTLEDPIDEIIEAFEILQKAGKIRYYGISSIRPKVIEEYVKRSNITSVMMQYSLLDRRLEEGCLQYLGDHKVGILARGSLAKGLLATKPAADYLDHSKVEVKHLQEQMLGIHNQISCIAQGYVLKSPVVASAVTGVSNLLQLKQNITQPPAILNSFQVQQLQSSIKRSSYTVLG